jgi:hypothetical protein
LACTQPGGAVTFEKPTAEERELAMGFPRGFSAAPGVSEATRRELLGQAMDLNSIMRVLAACQAGGVRRRAKWQTGGVAGSGGAPANFATGPGERWAGGARGLSRVSLPTQMDAGDTSTEGSSIQPGAEGTSAEEPGTGREDGQGANCRTIGKGPGGTLEGRTGTSEGQLGPGSMLGGRISAAGRQLGTAGMQPDDRLEGKQPGDGLEGQNTVAVEGPNHQGPTSSGGPRGVEEKG